MYRKQRRDAITSYRRQRHHRAWEREAAGLGSQGAASSELAGAVVVEVLAPPVTF